MSHKYQHDIDWKDSFHLRKPVLEAMLGSNRWQVTEDGARLAFDTSLSNLSPHERHIAEFALNPYITGENIFSGLSQQTAQVLAKSLYELFGPNGFYAK
ncbi:MAG: hypothetical protein HOP06_04830 [Methylotenera sp.]|nr:hypothetical protein [Methylotenera sp.]